MNTTQYALQELAELHEALGRVDPEACEELCRVLQSSSKILVAGAGRSGFMARAFAMRLMHLGFSAHVCGDAATPNLGAEDLFFVVSGSGETGSLVSMARKAKTLGAKVATVTTRPEGAIGQLATVAVQIPAPTPKADCAFKSAQPMGSLFEQGSLLLLDAVVARLMELMGVDETAMYARHANLE